MRGKRQLRGHIDLRARRAMFSVGFLALAGIALAIPRDILTHRDGTKIEGSIVQETAEKIIIRTEKYGELHYPKFDLIKVERGVDPEAQQTTATPTPPTYDYRVYIPEGPIDPERPPRPIPIAALIQKGITPPPPTGAPKAPQPSELPQAATPTPAPTLAAQAAPLVTPAVAQEPQLPPTATSRVIATPLAPTPTMVIAISPTPAAGQTPLAASQMTPTPPVALTPATIIATPAPPTLTPWPVVASPLVPSPVPTLQPTISPAPSAFATPPPAPTSVQTAASPATAAAGTLSPASLAEFFLAQPVPTASSASYLTAATPSAPQSDVVAIATPVAETASVAPLTVISGKASVQRPSGSAALAPGANVVEGETLQTGADETLFIGAAGGLILALGPSAELKILKTYQGAGLDLALTRGWLWAVAASNAPDKLVTLSAAGCQIAPDPTDLQQGLQLKVEVGAEGHLTLASFIGRLIVFDSVSDAHLTVPALRVVTYTPGSRRLEERPELMEPTRRDWERLRGIVEHRGQ